MENTVGTGIKVGVTRVSDKRIIDIRPGVFKLEHGRKAGAGTAMLGVTGFSRVVPVGLVLVTIFRDFSDVFLAFKAGVVPGCLGTKLKYACGDLEDE